MRRIFDENIVYTQDAGEFNMYCLNPSTKDLIYQFGICKTDDYHIGCYLGAEMIETKPVFEIFIDKNSLFYFPFIKFLGNKTEITIEDDLEFKKFGKKITISYLQDKISLRFEYEKESLNPYDVHVINILYDGRSLIDQNGEDTKDRLSELCSELYNTYENYNQGYDGPIKTLKR